MTNRNTAPFRLALLRHADAEWPLPGQRDFDRRLSLFGEKEAAKSGLFLRDFGFTLGAIVTSPATRCTQTITIILDAIGGAQSPSEEGALYNSNVDEYLNTVSQYIDQTSLLLAGHNPTLEELVVKLVGSPAANLAMPNGFPTGAVAIIDLEQGVDISKSRGELIAFFDPSQ